MAFFLVVANGVETVGAIGFDARFCFLCPMFFFMYALRFKSFELYLVHMHKIKNHIAKNFKHYFRAVFILQWIGLIGFIGFGVFGMWFFSSICMVISFLFYVLRIVLKHHTVQSFVESVKKLNALDVLDHLPLGGKAKRRIKRKHIRKHSKH